MNSNKIKMKLLTKLILATSLLISQINPTISQPCTLSKEYKMNSIEKLNQLMLDYYVFPEIARKTVKHLNRQFQDGHFDQFNDVDAFANALTLSVQEINKDKHMRIRKNRPYVAQEDTPERFIEERIYRRNRSRKDNLGINKIEFLEGNVAYLDLRGFAGIQRGKAKVDSYMKLMAEADAIIIDLGKNRGGSPKMVQYLCSYFFDQKLHLNSLYWREGDVTTEFWTLDEVGGKKMPKVPLFVITSSGTFSAAEEFSYNMQTQKRATLIGQTSGGGANPGGTMPINEDLNVFIPSGKAINPITKTNWEGVGVVPEVKVETAHAKEKAHELARVAAEKFRKESDEKLTRSLVKLYIQLEAYNGAKSSEAIFNSLQLCVEERYLEEYHINDLGYTYLMQFKKADVAEVLFLANTRLHPNSANTFDSYGEILKIKGDLEASLSSYQKAVQIALKNNDENLGVNKENLEMVKKKMAK